MRPRTVRFEELEAEWLRDPEFRAEYDRLEPAYQLARLRIAHGLTQAQLADLVGTRQPSIARFESGKTEPRLSFLRRVAKALGYRLETHFVPQDQTATGDAERVQEAPAPRPLPVRDS